MYRFALLNVNPIVSLFPVQDDLQTGPSNAPDQPSAVQPSMAVPKVSKAINVSLIANTLHVLLYQSCIFPKRSNHDMLQFRILSSSLTFYKTDRQIMIQAISSRQIGPSALTYFCELRKVSMATLHACRPILLRIKFAIEFKRLSTRATKVLY